MNKKEVEQFLLKIKSHYQNFSIEDYIVEEWQQALKNFDTIDVYNKLDKHLNGEYAANLPQIHFITKFLKTKKEKLLVKKGFIQCRYCGKKYASGAEEEWDKCEEKCRRIKYIKDKTAKYGLKLESNLKDMEMEEIDKVYEKLITYISDKYSDKLDPRELSVINRILGRNKNENIELYKTIA